MTFLEAVFSNLVAALLLAALALTVGRWCRRPALTHLLWVLVLVKLVTPPLVRVPMPWPFLASIPELPPPPGIMQEVFVEVAMPEPEETEGGEIALSDERPAVTRQSSWLIGVWLLGTVGWSVLAIRRARAFSRMLKLAAPAPLAIQERVAHLAEQLGLTRVPRVVEVPGRVAPLVWGARSPVLAVPAGITRHMSEAGLDTLLLHELAHIRRGDPWVRWLEFVTLALYWWCPLAWFASRELREAEEQCCDAWVVRVSPRSRRAYASALVDVVDFLSGAALPPLLASGLGQVADLKRRLTMILNGVIPHRLSRSASLAVTALAVLALPLVPSWSAAQAPKPESTKSLQLAVGEAGPFRIAVIMDDTSGLELELRKKLVEVEALKKRLQAARQASEQKQTLTITVEVKGAGKTADARAIVEAIKKALPGKQVVVNVKADTQNIVTRSVIRLNAKDKAGLLELVLSPKGKATLSCPACATPGRKGNLDKKLDNLKYSKAKAGDLEFKLVAPSATAADRIKLLETRLERLLQEIRKERQAGGK